jgi:hypothetical protein
MKKMIGSCALAFALFSMSGCATKVGTSQLSSLSSKKIKAFIQDGKTTKKEIFKRFGNSYHLKEDNQGREKWVYKLTKRVAKPSNFIPVINHITGGTNNTHYKLTVIFDENNIVTKHIFHTFEDESKQGVLWW